MSKIAEIRFPVPNDINIDEIVSVIQLDTGLVEEPAYAVNRVYIDSFDWRLFNAGITIWTENLEDIIHLYQRGIPNISSSRRLDSGSPVPRLPRDLPQGPIREAAEQYIEMRTLLPQVEVKSSVRALRLLDSAEKTVLRVLVEQQSSRTPGKGKFCHFGQDIRLLPVRGYQKPFINMRRMMTQKFGLKPAASPMWQDALRTIGKTAGDYSSKLSFSFDPEEPSAQAAREIHIHLLDVLEVNIPGTKANLDSEFLHDLRVAVRRTRSALTQIKGVFTDNQVEQFKSRLAWVGQLTGPTRDMDVFLLNFEQYRNSLPKKYQADLGPLHDFLENHQGLEHKAMVNKINSPHFRKLLKEWRDFLVTVPDVDDATEAETPVLELSRRRINKMFKRVLQEGTAITEESPAEMLHDLRKDCKKLRYLMEFFQCLYPKKKITRLIKAIKQLLNNLGDFQDLEVQADKLRDYARQMVEEGNAPHATLLAMGMLVDGLLRRQELSRAEFAERFADFAREENQLIFQELFAPHKKKKKKKGKS